MKCQYSFEEINNFFEGNISTDSYNEIEKHMESCKECKDYHSSLVLTGRCLIRSEGLNANVYEKILSKIDQNKYRSRKKWLYKFSGKISSHAKVLTSAAALIVVCLLTIISVSYREEIGSFTNTLFEKNDSISHEKITKEGISEKIKANGGIELKLYVKGKDQGKPNEDLINRTINTLKKRFEALGFIENEMNYDNEKGVIEIRAPWLSLNKDVDVEKNIREIIKTGEAEFKVADESNKDESGTSLPIGEVIISNNDIDKAEIQHDEVSNNLNIMISLKEEGSRRFSEATGKLIGKQIAVYMDNIIIAAPIVQQQITNGKVIINGDWSDTEVMVLAAMLGSEKLETNIEVAEFKEIPEDL
jgi:cell division protein FtsL